MARPSRPSVRLTALPAPTMMNAPKIRKNQPKFENHVLEKRNHQRVGQGIAAEPDHRVTSGNRDQCFDRKPDAAGETAVALLRHLQVIVIEADEAETERHREHDPDIGIGRIGPQQRRDDQSRQDHQPAHGGRALLGDEMRLRAIRPDRLAFALAKTKVVDDPGTEQKHEQSAGEHRAAGAKGDVAKDVQQSCGTGAEKARYWKGRSANKTFSPPYTASSSLPGKRFSSAVTIGFIFEPSDPLTMMASPARIAASTCNSSASALSA